MNAFTSGKLAAGSDDSPKLAVELKNGETKTIVLYDRPGDDMLANKGDLWKLRIDSFEFEQSCIRKKDIAKVTIKERGSDGWNIESIITVLRRAQDEYTVVTADIGVNRWIDSDDKPEYLSFDLTIV